jgi:hypothetical protein
MILICVAGVHAAESPAFFQGVPRVYYVDLKKEANAAFSFFFSNALLSFTPFDPRIRLRFQTLLSGC